MRQIYEYRKDYDEASVFADDAMKFVKTSVASLKRNDRDNCGSALDDCTEKLDDLVKFIATRRDELLKPLSQAYELLASPAKR